jgi:ceramide glucosyltransferase
VGAALSFLAVALIVTIAVTHLRLRGAVARPSPARGRLERYPSLTVIRPVRGVDVGAAENLAHALDDGYPGEVETLFVLDDASDPALPLVRRAVEERRGEPAARVDVLFAGAPPPGHTGKLHAMAVGVARASGELIAFADSDTRPDRALLRVLVETLLAAPDVGDCFAPVVMRGRPRSIGDVAHSLLVNAWYGPAAALETGPGGELPFIMGQVMLFRRSTLRAIGGVECAVGQLVDDMWIGRCVAEAGLRNVMVTHPLPIIAGGMSVGAFLRLFRRWLLFSRGGLPRAFTRRNWLRGVTYFACLATLAVALADGAWPAALLAALAALGWGASQLELAARFSSAAIPRRYGWVVLLLPLVAPFLFVSSWLYPRVAWRGRSYPLERSARLSASS